MSSVFLNKEKAPEVSLSGERGGDPRGRPQSPAASRITEREREREKTRFKNKKTIVLFNGFGVAKRRELHLHEDMDYRSDLPAASPRMGFGNGTIKYAAEI